MQLTILFDSTPLHISQTFLKTCLNTLLMSILPVALVACRPSVKLFSYYETLDYDPSELAAQHSRVTREADRGRGIQLHLHAYNR